MSVAPFLWPERLLTQNSELRKDHIWNWSLPAHHVRLTDGALFNTCPNAGACGRVCYAKSGTYRFSNVLARHVQNLECVLEAPDEWQARMIDEIAQKRFRPTGVPIRIDGAPDPSEVDPWLRLWLRSGGAAVRIHDGGDFFDLEYLRRWLTIANLHNDVLFYAYTKEVSLHRTPELRIPVNYRFLYSFGGREDRLIDRDQDRHADVFPSREALDAAGYFDQADNDLLAVLAPTTRIGIVANNIPAANKKFAGRTMSEMAVR